MQQGQQQEPGAGGGFGATSIRAPRAAWEERAGDKEAGKDGRGPGAAEAVAGPQVDMERVRKMQLQLQQRDNEINILVGMLKRRDGEFVLNNSSSSGAGGPTSESEGA